ncbi:hypothetical protein BV22DRAFT_1131261 [Leucogyrophana mollusca]|uniref:Uncharacterized protein n=1 Tax=Leucogyrophana mollusca TaxID=85980 RepID=A0ACB8BAF8_9AGAM|nr:hypothetical protein BV22DRAFT_1131261 [Leucogyrophana mollusca]
MPSLLFGRSRSSAKMPWFRWWGKTKTSSKSSTLETQSHDNTLAALSSVIVVLDSTKDLVPIDIAKGVLSTSSSILTIVKNTLQNKDDFAELISRCHRIARSIKRTTDGRSEADIDPNFVEALVELKRSGEHRDWKEQLDSFLQIWDHELIMPIDMKISNSEWMSKAGTEMESGEPDHEPPPGRPSMFFRRDDLVRGAVESLGLQHVVLVGPGGIGKSSIAKTIMNEDSIFAQSQGRRFFVRLDNIDALQITFDTFIRRIRRRSHCRSHRSSVDDILVVSKVAQSVE